MRSFADRKEKEGSLVANPSRESINHPANPWWSPFVGASTTAYRKQLYLSQCAACDPCRLGFILGTAPRVPKGYRESQFPQ